MPDSSASKPTRTGPYIHIVGVCGSGKSTLAQQLHLLGCQARQISQEHSGVPDLWRWRRQPDALVYLDASNEQVRQRYPWLNITDEYLRQERDRLAHAREHADCYVLTDGMTPEQVAQHVLKCLQAKGVLTTQDQKIPGSRSESGL
jgi:RNase adaptor protein for sRNA GlmZ degradation